jgi:hypothetical protein
MAARYWVGGTGTWDGTAGSKWALTNGGAGGQAVPTAADDVFFTGISGSATITIASGVAVCRILTMTGFTGTLAFGTNSITCAGTGTIYTGATTFNVTGTPLILCTDSSATSRTITATATTEVRSISFNISAGSGLVSVTGSLRSLIFSGTFTGSLDITSRTLYGNLTLKTGMTVLGTSAVTTTFAATSGTQTITSAGLTLDFPVALSGAGGTVTLADTFTSATFGSWTLNNGTFNANNQNIAISSFNSSNSNTRTIVMGSGTWTLTGTSPWNTATTTGLTFNANTSTIVITNSGAFFSGGSLTYSTVNFTGTATGTVNFTGANTFTNLSFTAPSVTGYKIALFPANQIVTGTLTVGGATPTNRFWLRSDTIGTPRTITAAAVSLQNVDFRDITGAGAAAPFTGTNLGNAAGNSSITFPAAKTVYWNLAGAQNWSATGWALTSTGTPAVANFPLPQDTATFTNAGSVTGTITVDQNWNIGTIDMSGRTSAMTFDTGTTILVICGNWINGSGTTINGTGLLTFSGKTAQSITSASKTFTQSITINSIGGTVRLTDALTIVATKTLTLLNGTFDAFNQNVTVGLFNSSTSNTRTLTMGSGTWTLSGTGIVWNTGTNIGLTFNVNTANIVLSDTSTTARTFTGGVLSYNKLTIGGTTGTSTTSITGGAGQSFTEIASTKTVAHTIALAGFLSVANWTVTGTAGNVVTVNSSAAGTQRAITYTGSGTISMDYMSIQDINFSYGLGATQPYLVYAGANSTNGGNNDGILFQPTTVKAYRLTTGTSWTVPADWNNSNNTIHMIGAGGSGANGATSGSNRAAGGGGGGGGYRVLTNETLTGSIPYTIGTSIGGAGGNTTFNTFNIAGGGGAGTATTTPSSTGGTGGTGNFVGGNGGAGSFAIATGTGHGGGGGGGAGGPIGIGGNGGNGNSNGVNNQIAGGGGGGNGGGSDGTNGAAGLGGNGGNNAYGVGGAIGTSTIGANGAFGGGGAGGVNGNGGTGGSDVDISNTIGGAGGNGGSGFNNNIANTGLYGGGGGGGPIITNGATSTGGAGSQGVIFIVYTPGAAVANTSSFFFMYNNVIH